MNEKQYVWIVTSRIAMAIDSDTKIEGVRSSIELAFRLMRELYPDVEYDPEMDSYCSQDEWGDMRRISIRRWEVL